MTGYQNRNSVHLVAIYYRVKALSALNSDNISADYKLSKAIASGSISTAQPFIRQALNHGFEWVMLYTAIGIWILAAISFKIFSKKTIQIT